MSDTDSSYLDPRGDTPVGSAWQIGDPSQGANDPLVDWASNLHRDDLAKYLQDPQGQAAEWAARGHPPPDQATMDAIHDHNDSMGTPSRSARADAAADSGPLAGPYRVDPRTGRLLNLTDPRNTTDTTRPSRRTISMQAQFDPAQEGGPQPGEGLGPGASQPAPGSPADRFRRWANPNVDYGPLPTPPTTAPAAPAPAGPAGPAPAPAQTAPPIAPAGGVMPPPSSQQQDQTTPKKEAPKEKTKLEVVGDALGDLGKAMQGVKAPEALKPPNIGAPSVRGPLQAGAPSLQALAAMLGGTQTGQVPASIMPVLRMLGKA